MAEPGSNTQYTAVVVPEAPSGTPVSTPTVTSTGLSQVVLWRVEVRIPAGHQGVTGLALVDSGQFIVPYSSDESAWLVGDDDLLDYPYGKELGANVALYAYNTGRFDHAWQVRLTYTPSSAVDIDQAVLVSPDVADWLVEIGE